MKFQSSRLHFNSKYLLSWISPHDYCCERELNRFVNTFHRIWSITHIYTEIIAWNSYLKFWIFSPWYNIEINNNTKIGNIQIASVLTLWHFISSILDLYIIKQRWSQLKSEIRCTVVWYANVYFDKHLQYVPYIK